MVNWPHNPTGATVPREVFAEVVALTEAAGATLVCDEVYRLLEHDPADRLPAGVEASERAVSIGVMSKAFGLAGLRIGWIATRDRALLGRVAALKDYTSICSSAPSEILALIALRARDAVLGRSRAIVEANLPVLHDFMDEHSERLDWVPPRAGTVAFPRLRDGRPAERLAEDLVAAEGVLLLPGPVFGEQRRPPAHRLRPARHARGPRAASGASSGRPRPEDHRGLDQAVERSVLGRRRPRLEHRAGCGSCRDPGPA